MEITISSLEISVSIWLLGSEHTRITNSSSAELDAIKAKRKQSKTSFNCNIMINEKEMKFYRLPKTHRFLEISRHKATCDLFGFIRNLAPKPYLNFQIRP